MRSCYRRIVVKIIQCFYNSDLMAEMRHDNTMSTHCRDVGALSLEPSHRQWMQRSYETYSNRAWPFCQSNCTPVSQRHRNDKTYLFLPNHRRKQRGFTRVDLRAAMLAFPSCIAVDSSGRLFHDLTRNHAGYQQVQNYARKNSCPFLPNNGSNIM